MRINQLQLTTHWTIRQMEYRTIELMVYQANGLELGVQYSQLVRSITCYPPARFQLLR